ncbi:hypothetical protein B0T18DRAFT_196285 [Schizothecium vesticola]|uniref:DUF7779 domain-containing protein n=1 Tax=Schizothecium vesticola TaxID=314040 RepID=A0AA40K3A2_9PEZI|nr:hypothetical protein B0T18DRAFT_196285 [Schizothecium vesticola]
MTSHPGGSQVPSPPDVSLDANSTSANGVALSPSGSARFQDSQHLPTVGKTFRVRGVPLQWDTERLQIIFPDAAPLPKPLQTGSKWRIPLPRSTSQPARLEYLTVDGDFYGLTPLFVPSPEDHKIDVVALSGLGGHAFGSFKERGGTHMWLRDSLPYDLAQEDTGRPLARVMTHGYESAVARSKNIQNLEDLATSFHHSLLALVSGITVKPIILVAHSLGGLIVKQAIITLSKSKREDDLRLIQAIYGIVFFGVPHNGMDISSLLPIVGDRPNRFLIESISRINSQILSIQQREFHRALGKEGDSEVICFYETLESPTAQEKDGRWAMTGPAAVLVTKASATHCRPWEDGAEHICAVARTHSDMVKFGPQDHEYDKARETLRGLVRRGLTKHRRTRASDASFLVPYNRNPDFIGRSETLKVLEQHLGFGQRQAKLGSRVALYGLGGIGKTQIALAYAYWLQEECPEVSVFWVHASSAERFHQAYASIAQDRQIPGHDDPKIDVLSLVKTWLQSKDRGQWLMVIDNADDAELFNQQGNLGQFVPECAHGSVLATTRNKVAGSRLTQSGRLIEIGKMDEDESRLLLQGKLEADNRSPDNLSALSSRLEHLPLALVQAAAFIREMSMSVREYLRLLEKSDQDLVSLLSQKFETVGRDPEAARAVAQTWILSFEQIQRQDTFAGELLSLMSLFDRQAIPKKFLSDYGERQQVQEPRGEMQLVKALGVLKAFSFITEDKDHGFDVHRLVQLVTREWLGKKGRMHRFAVQALLVVSHNYPYGNHENRAICSAYLPHVYEVLKFESTGLRDEILARASLLHCAAGFFDYHGQWKEAERFSMQAKELRKRVLGEEHPDTLWSMTELASIYAYQGRWKEAESLEVQVLRTKQKVLGEEHPDTLISMANLASTYCVQGRWKQAEDLQAKELTICSRVLGRNHLSTLSSISNLASTYQNQGRWKEAEELEVQVMETRKRVLGEEHPSTLNSISCLASTYSRQGRWKEAEKLEVQVMETEKRVLGEEHPYTLTNMGNLASTYRDQGQWKEAEELEVQVMETRKRVLGEEHPSTLNSISCLASTYSRQGRWKEAEKLEVQMMDTRKKVLGEEHPDTLSSMANLASTYDDQGRYKEAEELQAKELGICSRVLGEEHPSTLVSMANLAQTWRSQGRIDEALDLMCRCIELQQQVLGPDHPYTVSNISTLRRWKALAY